jgi:putative nucleotidyltransferase with HDIG domain
VFAVVLSVALAFVLFPVLPGEASLETGDVAFKTFEVDGEIVLDEGRTVTQAALRDIVDAGLLDNALERESLASAVIVALLAGVSLGLYLYLFQPREVNTVPRLVIVGMLVLVWVAGAKVFLSLTLPDDDRLFLGYILPVAAGPMLVAALLDGGLAVMLAGLLAFLGTFAGFYMPDARVAVSAEPLVSFQMFATFLMTGLMGVFAVHRAERVNRFLMAGGSVAAITFASLLAFWLIIPGREGVDLVWMLVASALGGLGSAVVTVGGMVVLGLIFGLTTRIQLMELGQLNHPLLRELQQKAPGTFHHSVIVGNLAEPAADLTGADPLLVRVGCYFHDVGKIGSPDYYIENQLQAENPHDKLPPASSANIVAEHTRFGRQLGRRYRLPARVRAFISEHHGTRLVTYFYRKASAEDPNVDPAKFRYPGPRPQSKETAIVMLADSVEAVVRSSRDRSPDRMDALVDGVIAERVAEGQLDECDLTLRNLKTIAESFKATLRGVYHPRIEYPSPTKAEGGSAGVPAGQAAYLRPPPGPVDGTAPPAEVERPRT